MTTDYRALCVELLDALESNHQTWRIPVSPLVARARAALAEPVGEGPTEEELLATLDKATADFPPRHPEAESLNAVEYPLALELRKARAVLARWGHQPAPPAEGEVAELARWLRMQGEAQKPGPNSLLSDRTKKEHHAAGVRLTRTADLLEQRHPEPVPVSGRLPEPGDCDDEGTCWAWNRTAHTWGLFRLDLTAHSHWLPATALPLPAAEVQP